MKAELRKGLRKGLLTEVIQFLDFAEETMFSAAGYHTWVDSIMIDKVEYGSYKSFFKNNLKEIKKGTDLGRIAYTVLPESGYTQYGTEIHLWSEMTIKGLMICVEVDQPYRDEDGWACQEHNKYFFM